MKKILSSILILTSMLTTSVFATTGINIYGYNSDIPHMTISNVISSDGSPYFLDYDGSYVTTYICESPVEIYLLDDMFLFNVEQIGIRNNLYEIYQIDLDFEGSQYVYSKDAYLTNEEIEVLEQTEQVITGGYLQGSKYTITEPGAYYAYAMYEDIEGSANAVFVILDSIGSIPIQKFPGNVETAIPTSSKVYVDGVEIAFDAYEICDNNYFKLRDIAQALNGSLKQFNVEYDGAITLIPNQVYQSVGGELLSKNSAIIKTGNITNQDINILIDDNLQTADISGYEIDYNNYFKLRDLGELFNFGVTWDATNNAIMIDTTTNYVPE